MQDIFSNSSIMQILKTVYKDGLESLITRNSPVLTKVPKMAVEGKELRFAAIYQGSPAAGSDYVKVYNNAVETGKNIEWIITPSRHFAAYTISQKELVAARSRRGSYATIIGNKTFASLEGLRKQLAKALYGKGHGEFYTFTAQGSQMQASGATGSLDLPEASTIALVPGTQFRIIAAGVVTPQVAVAPYSVIAVNDTSITYNGAGAQVTPQVGDELIFEGSVDASGTFWTAPGLPAWILDRTAQDYNARLTTPFYGVTRSVAPAQLGGQFYEQTGTDKIADTIMALIRKCRRAGGDPDLVIMNDIDAATLIGEIESQRTQFLAADQGQKKSISKGATSANFALWTSILDKIVDDPYCPQGTGYVLQTRDLEFTHYNNIDRVIETGNSTEEPGRADPLAEDGANYGEIGDKLLVEDCVSIEDGQRTSDGAVKVIAFNLFYSFCLWNTASSGMFKLA